MNRYLNRYQAGKVLAQSLLDFANRQDVIVLGLPRGGVPVAYEVAKALHAPLDVFIVRKLGVPGHPELAMGAISIGGVCVLNDGVIADLNIKAEAIQSVKQAEEMELARRELAYRGDRPFPSLEDKTVILVDDGIATGATMRAAIQAVEALNANAIVVAVPVADGDICKEMMRKVDYLACPLQPANFYAVGAWYQDFSQTEDEEVCRLLRDYMMSSS